MAIHVTLSVLEDAEMETGFCFSLGETFVESHALKNVHGILALIVALVHFFMSRSAYY